jgi:hypothetical protein
METIEGAAIPRGAGCAPEHARTIPPLAAFGAIYVGAIAALRFVPLSQAAQIAVALLPVPFFAYYILRWVTALRRLDELQRLITLEALGIAFPLALLVVMSLGLMQLAGVRGIEAIDYLRLWPVLFWLYFVGLFIARKRYR